jgi:flagellar export protein FliJ
MNRFQFTLAQVLRFKRQCEQMAELREMHARAEVESAERRVHDLQQQLERLARRTADGRLSEIANISWPAHFELSTTLSTALQKAEGELSKTSEVLKEAEQQRVQLGKEVEALDVLREQQQNEHWRQTQRQQQVEMDETSLRNWSPTEID